MQGLDSFIEQHPSSEYDILHKQSEEQKQAIELEKQRKEKDKDSEEEGEIKDPTFIIKGVDQYQPMRSLYLFDKDNVFRIKMVELMNHPYFEQSILLCILLNSSFIAFQDYINPYDTSHPGNWISDKSERWFTIIFLIEALVKIVAMGFIIDENSQLRDEWNWLDFVVVASSLYSFTSTSNSNQSSLRTVRLFKPLKTLNTMPSMKKLLTTVGNSLLSLGNILLLMMFFFVIFSILSISLWKGSHHQFCRLTPVPVDGIWPVDTSILHLCGGNFNCPQRTYCGTNFIDNANNNLISQAQSGRAVDILWFGNVITGNRFRDAQRDFLNWGLTTWDRVEQAFVAIFQSTTLEGWSTLMQRVSESYSLQFARIYFIAIFFVCSFLILNLIIAVLWDKQVNLDDSGGDLAKEEEDGALEDDDEEEENLSGADSSSIFSEFLSMLHRNFIEIKWLSKGEIEFELNLNFDGESTEQSESKFDNPIQVWLQNVQRQNVFDSFITICILLNTVAMASDSYPALSNELPFYLTLANQVFTSIFTMECIIKILSQGFDNQSSDQYNVFDLVIVIVSILEILTVEVLSAFGTFSLNLSAFRTLRLLRIFKLVKSNESLSLLFESIAQTIVKLQTFAVLLFLIILVFTLFGMQSFAGKIRLDADGQVNVNKQGIPDPNVLPPKQNFDTLLNSIVTIFQVLTGEDWQIIMQDTVRCTNKWTQLYFILLVVIGNFVMLNLFLAILLGNFMEVRDSIEQERLKRKRDEKMHLRNLLKARNTDFISAHQEANMDDNKKTKKSLFLLAHHDVKEKAGAKDDIDVRTHVHLEETPIPQQLSEDANKNNRGNENMTIMEQVWSRMRLSSFFIFSKKNKFRLLCTKIDQNEHFQFFVIVCIVISSVLVVFDSPAYSNSSEFITNIIQYTDRFFTIVFVIEMLVKMITYNVFQSNEHIMDESEDAQFMYSANWLDFFIVVVSVFDWASNYFTVSSSGAGFSLSTFKALRAFRALRPIRTIQRFEGLKTLLEALLKSMPSMFHVLMVMALFIFLFAIICINMFGGKFQRCVYPGDLPFQAQDVANKFACLARGGIWQNHTNNFDNMGEALLTLFEIMTSEGWPQVMGLGIDATEQEWVMMSNSTEGLSRVIFVAWIIIGNFLVLNLFVGVIIDNFNLIKEKQSGVSMLTREQKVWVEIQRLFLKKKPCKMITPPEDKWRNAVYRLINKNSVISLTENLSVNINVFEYFITGCILCNTITMALNQYPLTTRQDALISNFNTVFAVIFNLEFILKFQAFFMDQFLDSWNMFDFLVVLGTDLGMIVSSPWLTFLVPSTLNLRSAMSVIRTFRILRVVRLIKNLKELRLLIDTLIFILPSLVNIAILFFMGLQIFTAVGMNILPKVRWNGQVDFNANFEKFGSSMMLLMRCSSGEAWNNLMHDFAFTGDYERQLHALSGNFPGVKYTCFTDDTQQALRGISTECGKSISQPIFLFFTVALSMMILNMFIAIVLEGFTESMNDSKRCINTDSYERFRELYSEFDLKNHPHTPSICNWISIEDASQLMYELEPPFGFRDMHLYPESFEADQLTLLQQCVYKLQSLMSFENGEYKEVVGFRKDLLTMLDKYPRLREQLKFKFEELWKQGEINFGCFWNFERESQFMDFIKDETQATEAHFAKILNSPCDLEDKNFLEFWQNNRLVKVKDKDKIKCWRQLGNIIIFKLLEELLPGSKRKDSNNPLARVQSIHHTVNFSRKEQFHYYKIHIKELLIALSRRAIIQDNITKEIDYIQNEEKKEWLDKMKVVQNEQEKAALRKPKRPNFASLDIMYLKLTHKSCRIPNGNVNKYYFQNLQNMEIHDQTNVFKQLDALWNETYFEQNRMDEFVKELKMSSKNNRFEWVLLNPGKIYSFRAICMQYYNRREQRQGAGKVDQVLLSHNVADYYKYQNAFVSGQSKFQQEQNPMRTSLILNLIKFKQLLDPYDVQSQGKPLEGKTIPQFSWNNSRLYSAFIRRLMSFTVQRQKFDFLTQLEEICESKIDKYFRSTEVYESIVNNQKKQNDSMTQNPFESSVLNSSQSNDSMFFRNLKRFETQNKAQQKIAKSLNPDDCNFDVFVTTNQSNFENGIEQINRIYNKKLINGHDIYGKLNEVDNEHQNESTNNYSPIKNGQKLNDTGLNGAKVHPNNIDLNNNVINDN